MYNKMLVQTRKKHSSQKHRTVLIYQIWPSTRSRSKVRLWVRSASLWCLSQYNLIQLKGITEITKACQGLGVTFWNIYTFKGYYRINKVMQGVGGYILKFPVVHLIYTLNRIMKYSIKYDLCRLK